MPSVLPAFDTLVLNIACLISADQARASDDDPLGCIADAALAIKDGRVVWVGARRDLPQDAHASAATRINARGGVVGPGLIDSHTHLVFGGSREAEFARRLAGTPYMQIAAEGGGIRATVRHTRAATEDTLFTRAAAWLDEMASWGVTTVEAKSGYGLDIASELKQLRVHARLQQTHPTRLVSTFMGAHDFPDEFTGDHDGYVNLLLEEMLPAVAESGLATFCDAFCEDGVFSVRDTRRIMLRAHELGFALRLHADEFAQGFGGAELAAELGCAAADHLMTISDAGIAVLAENGVVAGLLPATTYTLGSHSYAPARKMLAAGVCVALASDFNPGSCTCSNLPLVMNMACTQMRLSFPEAFLAVTRNAARALLLQDECGALKPGLSADFVIWDIPRPEYLVYHLGRRHTHAVYRAGRLIFSETRSPVFLSGE